MVWNRLTFPFLDEKYYSHSSSNPETETLYNTWMFANVKLLQSHFTTALYYNSIQAFYTLFTCTMQFQHRQTYEVLH